jgi:cytochrome c oxidase cbb3-type subunit 3
MGAPNLTDNIWLYGGSLEAIKQTLANGRQGQMPAHGGFLGAAKVHLLATYVYNLSQNNVTKTAAK